jgi:hypothetical protein
LVVTGSSAFADDDNGESAPYIELRIQAPHDSRLLTFALA